MTSIKEELQKLGISIDDIYDLVNTRKSYPQAIPVLIDSLRRGITDEKIKEGVIRALAVKEAKGLAGTVLLEEYFKTPCEKTLLRWIIGNTIEVIITENEAETVLDIVKDKTNGMSRQMFVLALGKIKSGKVENILAELLDDNEVASQAQIALKRLKSVRAKVS